MFEHAQHYVSSGAWNFVNEFLEVLLAMSPWLLLGFVIAGLLPLVLPADKIEKHLGGRGAWPVIKAAAFGVPIPLCSCSVIPVAASLRKHGASRGSTLAFFISAPQTGVDSILVTYSLLGGVFAVFRPVVALVSGVIGGVLTNFGDRRANEPEVKEEPACADSCCSTTKGVRKIGEALRYGLVTLPSDIGKSLVIGLLIAAVIAALLPKDMFAGSLGTGVTGILVMMLLGIPIYVCATASVPVAASLMMLGASPGAAFAFLVTGPASNAASIASIWRIMGPRTTIIYLLTIAATAFLGGLALDGLLKFVNLPAMNHMAAHEMLPYWFQAACAAVLTGLLANAMLRKGKKAPGPVEQMEADGGSTPCTDSCCSGATAGGEATAGDPNAGSPQEIQLTIGGLSCAHCAIDIQTILRSCPGVRTVQVDAPSGRTIVRGTALDESILCKTVTKAGYTVKATTKEEGT